MKQLKVSAGFGIVCLASCILASLLIEEKEQARTDLEVVELETDQTNNKQVNTTTIETLTWD